MKVNNLLSIMFNAIRARLMPIWVKIRMWVTPAYLFAALTMLIRKFFVKLLDVRPRDAGDYYTVFQWMISKRLVVAVVVGLAVCSLVYINAVLPDDFLSGGSDSVHTYQYRSLPLKFCSGNVNILGKGGYLAYSGAVEKGAASGHGILYSRNGATVYEGQFADSMYNGQGTLYYSSGTPRYTGTFKNNQFHGTGDYFWTNGALQYRGDFTSGERSGAGTLYNSVGSKIYQGSFLANEIVYYDFLDRTTRETSELYSGEVQVYQSEDEYCVAMPEISAVYSVKDGSNTLENEWKVNRVLVLKDEITVDGVLCDSVSMLQNLMGKPLYFGTVWVDLAEVISWNMLAEEYPDLVNRVKVSCEPGFENVFDVSGYDRDYQLYLYTFEHSGVLYHFYFTGAGASEFLMYAIEKA